MPLRMIALASLIAAAMSGPTAAADVLDGVPDFEMITPGDGGGAPQLIGGQPARPGDWPATFIFRTGSSGCTATAVGQHVVLTAAHCVPNGGRASIRTRNNGTLSLTCDHHPRYSSNTQADFALCYSATAITGIPLESIHASLAYPRVNDPVILIGYGCTSTGGHDHNFGVLYFGGSKVISRPTAANLYTRTEGGAAVCFGDSGGSAYFNLTSNGNRRVIFGVNSRGNIATTSTISSTATATFTEWAERWSDKIDAIDEIDDDDAAICGLDLDARGCR